MKEKSLEGFIQYVEAQDPDREIDHTNFCTCAVGEYLESDGQTGLQWASKNLWPLDVWTSDHATFGALAEVLRNAER